MASQERSKRLTDENDETIEELDIPRLPNPCYPFSEASSPDNIEALFSHRDSLRFDNTFRFTETVSMMPPLFQSAEEIDPSRIEYLDEDLKTRTEKRRRKNKKPPQGNNIFGRGGTLACRACRNRKSKFCQDRNITEPCIKIGRDEFKSGTPFNKSVTKSGDCRTEDRMLFEYAYSDQLFLALLDVSELLKTLAAEYGNIPSHASLRHSICALAASYLPSDQFHAQYDNHKRLALAPLMRKIKHHQNFDDTDVFAAGLLVYGIGQGDSSGTDIFAVSKICMSLFRYLTQKEHSGLLSVFGSAVVDFCVTRLVTLRAYPLSSSMPVILTYHTPFSQRLKYYQEICRTTSVPAAWQSSLVEAAFDTVGRLLCLSYLCVSEVLKKEVAGDFERDATVASALEYITAELDDPEFNNYLGVLIDLLPDPSITYETADDWLTVSLLLGIQCVRVFETLLRSTNMMEGLESAKEFFSPDLINLCHTERFKEFPYQYYGFVPFIHGVLLVLIGCTLTDDTLPVISQLQNLGRHETIIGLQLFWMNRNVKNFQRVLENEYPYRKFVNQGAAAQDTPV